MRLLVDLLAYVAIILLSGVLAMMLSLAEGNGGGMDPFTSAFLFLPVTFLCLSGFGIFVFRKWRKQQANAADRP